MPSCKLLETFRNFQQALTNQLAEVLRLRLLSPNPVFHMHTRARTRTRTYITPEVRYLSWNREGSIPYNHDCRTQWEGRSFFLIVSPASRSLRHLADARGCSSLRRAKPTGGRVSETRNSSEIGCAFSQMAKLFRWTAHI